MVQRRIFVDLQQTNRRQQNAHKQQNPYNQI